MHNYLLSQEHKCTSNLHAFVLLQLLIGTHTAFTSCVSEPETLSSITHVRISHCPVLFVVAFFGQRVSQT